MRRTGQRGGGGGSEGRDDGLEEVRAGVRGRQVLVLVAVGGGACESDRKRECRACGGAREWAADLWTHDKHGRFLMIGDRRTSG